MARSAEQKAADEALRTAVWNVIKLLPPAPCDKDGDHTPEASGVLTKFMVLAVQVRFDEDGDPADAINILFSEGSMLGYEAEGLLKMADRTFASGAIRATHGRYTEEE